MEILYRPTIKIAVTSVIWLHDLSLLCRFSETRYCHGRKNESVSAVLDYMVLLLWSVPRADNWRRSKWVLKIISGLPAGFLEDLKMVVLTWRRRWRFVLTYIEEWRCEEPRYLACWRMKIINCHICWRWRLHFKTVKGWGFEDST